MSRDSDDDALRWGGDDDPTLAPGWTVVGGPAAESPPAGGSEGAETDDPAANDTDADDADAPGGVAEAPSRAETGSLELVVLGVLGGVYLLYTVGWLITVVRTDAPGTSVLGDAMYRLGLWLAVLAPALWFGMTFALVRRAPLRLVWLAVGALVLVPLPFALGVTA